jgi:cytoplasmic iron level regulating protein YaaA (DUF328/UPF0246 family)
VLVLLPPSETKTTGGSGPGLDLECLSRPHLTPLRRRLIDTLSDLGRDIPASLRALGLTPRQSPLVALNTALHTSPTLPALDRYTGVLYDAFGHRSLPRSARARADRMLIVGSALFGAVRATDPIPAYRLSAGSALPSIGTLSAFWRPALVPALATEDFVVDLRSAAYAALAPLPDAVTVRVLSESPNGTRTVVSHASKHTKGLLARALVSSRADVTDVRGLVRVLRRAAFSVEHAAPTVLDVILRGP